MVLFCLEILSIMLFILPVVFALLPISAVSLSVTQGQLGQFQNTLQVDLPLDADISLFKRQVQDRKRKQPFSSEADGNKNKRLQVQLERQSSIHSSTGSNYIESPPSPVTQRMNELRELINGPSSHNSQNSHSFNHRENPPSPTRKMNELRELINAPSSPQRVQYPHSPTASGHSVTPPSPTTQRMNELRQLINAPPSPKVSQHTPTYSTSGHRENIIAKEEKHSGRSSPTSTILQGITPNTKTQHSNSIPKLFSKEVLRSKFRERPKGYDTNENTIARAAETLIRNKKAVNHDKAIEIAKDKLEAKKIGNREKLRNWKQIASTDPSKAREMKTNVPKNMPEKLYVAARAHQLDHRGIAKDMNEATRLAKEEAVKAKEYKKKTDKKYRTSGRKKATMQKKAAARF